MDFGAHLPLMDFGGHPYTFGHLAGYTETAARLGFRALSANDHMAFSVPWLDGPTALAAMIGHSATMTLATTVALPVVRGPVPLAKTLAAIDRLSDGRLVVGVGPGSSEKDYDYVGVDFTERWERLDESIGALRALWRPEATPFVGRFYSTAGVTLDPHPRAPKDRRSGSAAGGRRPACAAPPAWPTGGWRPRTTRRRPCSPNVVPPPRPAPRSRQGPGDLSERARDHVVLHHRQRSGGRPGHATTDRADHPPPRGDAPRPTARRPGRAVRGETLGLRARRCPAGVPLARGRRGTPARAVLGHSAAGHRRVGTLLGTRGWPRAPTEPATASRSPRTSKRWPTPTVNGASRYSSTSTRALTVASCSPRSRPGPWHSSPSAPTASASPRLQFYRPRNSLAPLKL